jgi:hypothetical protein
VVLKGKLTGFFLATSGRRSMFIIKIFGIPTVPRGCSAKRSFVIATRPGEHGAVRVKADVGRIMSEVFGLLVSLYLFAGSVPVFISSRF